MKNHNSASTGARRNVRRGKVLVFVAMLLPVLIAIVGLILDGGMLTCRHQSDQHTADAAATFAAMELLRGSGAAAAAADAENYALASGEMASPNISVNIPPSNGAYQGRSGYAEVVIQDAKDVYFMPALGFPQQQPLTVRAVAGSEDSTAGAIIALLDPAPEPFTIAPIPPILPALPTLVAGLEVLGLGQLRVDGAVHVNNRWGGVDENGNPAGSNPGPPYAVSCTPILPLTKLMARDIRAVGGVGNTANYGAFDPSEGQPLKANALPVPDPYLNLPVPTLTSDPANVSANYYGGVTVTGLPLIGPPVTLEPGIYDYIEVVSGIANFNPGIYIIRGQHPVTGIALNVLSGTVNAEGVMFYITNTATYSPASGAPDSSDGETAPPPPGVPTLLPSVVVNNNLLNSNFTGLNSPGSPFDGMLFYQRRQDRRPLVLAHTSLLGGELSGTTYAKWGHVILVGQGTYEACFVAGTMRVITVIDCTLQSDDLLPPARDVFLVE